MSMGYTWQRCAVLNICTSRSCMFNMPNESINLRRNLFSWPNLDFLSARVVTEMLLLLFYRYIKIYFDSVV